MKTFLRVILGVFLIGMGGNKFFSYLSMPEMSEPAGQFMGALVETGYMMPMIGMVELVCGFLILFHATAAFGLLLLAPLSVNLIAFHVFLDISTIGGAAFVAGLNLVLGVIYFDHYRPIFAELFTERVTITDKKTPEAPRPVAVVNS